MTHIPKWTKRRKWRSHVERCIKHTSVFRWHDDTETFSTLLDFWEGAIWSLTADSTRKGSVMVYSLLLAWTSGLTKVRLPVIWDAMTITRRHCNESVIAGHLHYMYAFMFHLYNNKYLSDVNPKHIFNMVQHFGDIMIQKHFPYYWTLWEEPSDHGFSISVTSWFRNTFPITGLCERNHLTTGVIPLTFTAVWQTYT